MQTKAMYSTGEIAKLCNISVRTVQYYDSRELVIPTGISEGGRRLYSNEDLAKMKIVCFLRDLNIPINTVAKILKEANSTYKTRDCNVIETEKTEEPKTSVSFGKMIYVSGLLFLFIPAFSRTALDSGVKAWVPTMIMENYGVSASFATALTTILVVVNLAGVFLLNFIYPKRINNAVTVYMLFFLLWYIYKWYNKKFQISTIS